MRRNALAVHIQEKKGRPVWMTVSLGKLSFENGKLEFEERKLLQSIPFNRRKFEETNEVARELGFDRYVRRSTEKPSLTLPQWDEQPEMF